MKSILFTVTTDISFDQRMQRICSSLARNGFQVTLVGRLKKDSIPLKTFPFSTHRIPCFFEKGKFFYLEYNLRLYFFLLFSKTDILGAIDLDTIVPLYIISKFKRKPLVYDAHEYFTEVIEVVDRPFIKKCWLWIEKTIVPRLQYAYTVSENLRRIFSDTYHVPFELIRNISELEYFSEEQKEERYIIYAGVVNAGRGLEQLIEAMPLLPLKLMICGKGDLYETLLQKVKDLDLEEKVIFKGYVPPDVLKIYIRKAYIGYLLLENKGLSYYYSLANKFFDYMHAGIPQVTVDFPEYVFINREFPVAAIVPLEKEAITSAMLKLCEDKEYYQTLVAGARKAREVYNWQKEELKLIAFYKKISH